MRSGLKHQPKTLEPPLHGVDTVDNIVKQNTTEHTIMTTVPLHWVSTIMATAPLHWVDTVDNIIEPNTT